jgi:hypothetical protein
MHPALRLHELDGMIALVPQDNLLIASRPGARAGRRWSWHLLDRDGKVVWALLR